MYGRCVTSQKISSNQMPTPWTFTRFSSASFIEYIFNQKLRNFSTRRGQHIQNKLKCEIKTMMVIYDRVEYIYKHQIMIWVNCGCLNSRVYLMSIVYTYAHKFYVHNGSF